MLRRLFVLVAVVGLVLALTEAAFGATVTVRVEGKSQSIFGSSATKVSAANALQALDSASTAGEFFFQLTHSSFGDYVSQIGKYPAAGSAGWVFKVNGVSPPVGADQVVLKDGDSVLWYYATFGATGGPPTLDLKAGTASNCYALTSVDDAGKPVALKSASLYVDGRKIAVDAKGSGCVGAHRGTVRAYAVGAVRSNAVK